MYNFLFCSAGRRVKLLKNFKETLGNDGKIVVAENSIYAPSRYVADVAYTVPKIENEIYIDELLKICKKESIDAILTLIDPEIEILSKNRKRFEDLGVIVLVPSQHTAEICFDKYKMYQYLLKNNIKTITTYDTFSEFNDAFLKKQIDFPVFVKPRTGSGSVGARKIENLEELKKAVKEDSKLIIQEYMNGIDLDADVYVDTISKKPISIFTKRKLETKIGGASKTISFKDDKLFDLIKNIIPLFEFNGTIDIDFFYKDGEYYMSEINPRFGGAYLHAYGAGINFINLIKNNIDGIENVEDIGKYEDDIVMMMYDDVIIQKINGDGNGK